MTREEQIQYYEERMSECDKLDTIRFKNNKKFWKYRLEQYLKGEQPQY
mgnify:CR=1 FL=1